VSRQATLIAVAAALAAAATAVAGCGGDGGDSAQLDALRGDPMASYEPPGGELVDTEEQSEGKTTLGKPQLAKVSRLFALSGDGEAALDDAVAAAEDAGWTFAGDPEQSVGGVVGLGTRSLPTGKARIAVTLYTDDSALRDDVSPPALKIALEHLDS
jgi:hypothetical protein